MNPLTHFDEMQLKTGTDAEEIQRLQARIRELEALVYVPGLWRCGKCNFQLVQATLHAGDGSISTRDKPGEQCPNCDVPLWRITEREAGNSLVDQLNDLSTQFSERDREPEVYLQRT